MRQLRKFFIAGIIMLFLLTSLAQADLKNGLVLYMPFDEGSGTTAHDQSGNKHDGSIKGATWTNGQFGKALKFDGKSNFVEIPYANDFAITDGITLGAWVTANVPFPQNWRAVINARKSTYGPYLLQTGASAAAPLAEMGIYIGGAWTWAQSKTPLDKDFHFVVGTFDANKSYVMYIDGKQNDGPNSGAAKGNIDLDKGKEGVVIGHDYGFDPRWWDGIIDEVIIYNRAITADEVAQLFKTQLSVAMAVGSAGKLATTWGEVKELR